MGSNLSGHASVIDLGPCQGPHKEIKLHTCPQAESLVRSHTESPTVSLESVSSQDLKLSVSCSPSLSPTPCPFANGIPPPSLCLDSQSLALWLAMDLCHCFHHLLDEGTYKENYLFPLNFSLLWSTGLWSMTF